jgi:arginyl-tRNA synthetase
MYPDGLVHAIATALAALGVDAPASITLERPRQREHGDWATNVAMQVAKPAGRNPRELAGHLADALNADLPEHTAVFEVAGPGFINIRLAPSWRAELVRRVVDAGVEQFAAATQPGRHINVEFVSANPTGPLHAGHGRWAAYGDALARVLERCGHRVHREFYVNDRGVQIQHYAHSLLARRHDRPLPEDGYQGQYVVDWAADMPADIDDVDSAVEWGLVKAHDYQAASLAAMGVVFDTWSSERALVAGGAMDDVLSVLRASGDVYESEGATWLRTTDHGDDKDRVLIKADGQPTYFLPDIAYHRDKFKRGDLLINVLGADHHGYTARMRAAMISLGHDGADFEPVIGQNVVLLRDGAEVRLSKRTGEIIELGEVVDEVGADATRFSYLAMSIDTKLTFDLEVAKRQSMDNPVFYVQMAHARLAGVMRTAAAKGVGRVALDGVDLTLLVHEREFTLIDQIAALPAVMCEAAERRAPNKLVTYARELAAAIHGFYHDCWIISDEVPAPLAQARLWLCEAARVALRVSLDTLGVSAPDEMVRLDDDATASAGESDG